MMRIRLILETLFLFLAALSLSEACGKVREPEAVRFEVSPSTLSADAPGGQVAFSVLSSEDWMASADQSWAKLLTPAAESLWLKAFPAPKIFWLLLPPSTTAAP